MAALASSLIRQRREVKDPQANRQVANKRKPCPKANKSLCQKQILLLISKVRLCGNRGRKLEKRPGESTLIFLFSVFFSFFLVFLSFPLRFRIVSLVWFIKRKAL
ncbi:unnamed protein product [Oncorhynchus mykiss]|uniref:Fibroblast growth factor 11 n=1 Tax=Oncorhynchus mykiss TaxID=8022 RepID=A0A060Z4W0_ONCMY|nr:unnamed protein product [Oncorhynchus mykiss]